MTSWLIFLSLGALMGCGGTSSDTALEEADADTDADADADVPLTFTIDGDHTGTILNLQQLIFIEDAFEIGDVLASVPASHTPLIVAVPDPDPADLTPIDPSNPSLVGAFYLPTLQRDDDSDGSGDGAVTAAGLVWPLFLSGSIPSELRSLGLVEGWNAIEMDPTGATEIPILHEITAIPLAVNLALEASISIGGTYDAESPPAKALSLAMAPLDVFDGDIAEALLYDDAMATSWVIDISGPPPAEHISDEDSGYSAALEILLAYIDSNEDGELSDGDAPLYTACYEGNPVVTAYFEPPTDALYALSFALNDIVSGWQAYTIDESDRFLPLSSAEQLSLYIDETCSLE